jgi:hypothetical protein
VRKIKLNSCLFILKTDEIKLLIISEIEGKKGSGETPAVGGGERILRREEGVVGITPSSLLKHFAPWAPAQKNK